MKPGWKNIVCFLLVGALASGFWLDSAAQDKEEEKAPEFIGQLIGTPKCAVCHKSAKKGEQMAIWEASSHARAFETLASDPAKAIAAEMGIADPQKAPECLSCHTTDGFFGEAVQVSEKSKYDPSEGVGCEACHGPGSEYKSMKVMKDSEASLAAGLIVPTQDTCLMCHNEKSPTFKEFDFEKRWAEIAHPIPKPEG